MTATHLSVIATHGKVESHAGFIFLWVQWKAEIEPDGADRGEESYPDTVAGALVGERAMLIAEEDISDINKGVQRYPFGNPPLELNARCRKDVTSYNVPEFTAGAEGVFAKSSY